MMPNCPGHGGVLAVRDPKLLGGLLDDPGQRSVVGMAHERTQMVSDMVVEAAREPSDERVFRRIIGCCREDMVDAIVKLAAVCGKVGAINCVRRLEHECRV